MPILRILPSAVDTIPDRQFVVAASGGASRFPGVMRILGNKEPYLSRRKATAIPAALPDQFLASGDAAATSRHGGLLYPRNPDFTDQSRKALVKKSSIGLIT